MLYKDAYISKVVCLKCGKKVDLDKLAILDVSEMEDVPEDIKARGAFFQTFACPECKTSMFLGFVAEEEESAEEEAKPVVKKRRRRRNKKTANADKQPVVEDKGIEETGIAKNPRVKRAEDGTIDIEASVNRLPQQKAKCSQCGKEFDVGTQDMMAFGSKCKSCMSSLIGGGKR